VSAPGRTLATVTAAQVLNVASSTVVAVALPSIGRELHADGTAQQWVVDAFVLVFASLLVAGGTIADRIGHRTALLAGLSVFALGSVWCAVAPNVEWLVAGRVVQALGPPLTLPASLALVTEAYSDPGARARAIGIWGAGSGTGLALGPLAGGLIVDTLGWRWVFGINLPVCAVLVALILSGAGLMPQKLEPPAMIAYMAKVAWWKKALVVFSAMTVEEAFFRGFLQKRIGLIASTILFAVAHAGYAQPMLLIGVTIISLIIGTAFYRTKNLWPCIIAHGVFDAIQIFVIVPAALKFMPV
jgi:MFS family permease